MRHPERLLTHVHLTLTFRRRAPLLQNTMFNNQVEKDSDEGSGWAKETLMGGWKGMRGK